MHLIKLWDILMQTNGIKCLHSLTCKQRAFRTIPEPLVCLWALINGSVCSSARFHNTHSLHNCSRKGDGERRLERGGYTHPCTSDSNGLGIMWEMPFFLFVLHIETPRSVLMHQYQFLFVPIVGLILLIFPGFFFFCIFFNSRKVFAIKLFLHFGWLLEHAAHLGAGCGDFQFTN